MNKFTIIVIGLLVALAALVYFASQSGPSSNLSTEERADIMAIKEDDHIQGDVDSNVVLITYGDFECPACAAYHPLVKAVVDAYGEEIAIVTRHFPLRIHPNARTAAQATEAAALQGAFYEMGSLLFERQAEWAGQMANVGIFEPYATELGLDLAQFQADIRSSEVEDRVARDLSDAQTLGLNSTPTFILQGEVITGMQSLQDFALLIDAALEEANMQEEELATTTASTS